MKKLKIYSIALLLVILAGCALILLSCNSDPCADGHTEVADAAVPATCAASGLTEGKHCSVCNKIVTAQEKTEKLAHDFGEWTVSVTPTCAQEGSQYRTCKSCGVIEAQVLEAHTFESWATVTEPTCEQSGLRTSACAECGIVKEELIAPAGHTKSTAWEKLSESSCSVAGKEGKKCTTCGTVLEMRALATAAHDMAGWTVTTPAECLVNGTETNACRNCAYTQTRAITAPGHSFGTPTVISTATCTQNGESERECSACHEIETTITAALPHTPKSTWTVVIEATDTHHGSSKLECSVCPAVIETRVDYSPNPSLTFSYLVEGNSITITGYGPGATPDLVIPEQIDGKNVTKIASGAFAAAERFTSITFPATLTIIEAGAFDGCTLVTENGGIQYLNNWIVGCSNKNITTLNVGANVLGIAEGVFADCTKLNDITVTNNTRFAVASNYLYNTATGTLLLAKKNLTGSLSVPSTITAIANGAFKSCFALHEITIPTSVKRVGTDAFAECHTLVRVMNLSGLSITLPSNPGMEKKTSGSFTTTMTTTNGMVLYKPNNYTTYLIGYTGTSSVLDLTGKGVTAIYQYALCNNKIVKELTIPNTVQALGENALANCELTKATMHMQWVPYICYTQLRSLIITGVTDRYEIPSNLLAGCTTLEELEIPNDARVSRKGAFAGCTGVKVLRAPANVLSTDLDLSSLEVLYITGGDSIPAKAFLNHANLKEVHIAASVEKVGGQAFMGCAKLTTLTFESGSNLKEIVANAFCSTPLKTIDLKSTKLTKIGSQTFMSCAQLTSILLPSTLTTFDEEVFNGCSSLTSITIPANVTSMGNRSANDVVRGTFNGCTSLTSVTFEAGSKLEMISTYCFYGCTSLTSITIPASVTSIGHRAFENSGVTSITFENTSGWKAYAMTSFSTQVKQHEFTNLGTGTSVTVTTPATNATNFKTTYKNYIWVCG